MRVSGLVALVLLAAGCRGPLPTPMVERLSEAQQLEVDAAWNNLFTPIDRVDREVLLDAIVLHQLHQSGVDSLRLVAEKALDGGRVIMEIRFDRARPEDDVFLLTCLDFMGFAVRHERWSGDEVRQRVADLEPPPIILAEGQTEPTAEQQRALDDHRARLQARMEAVRAATESAPDESE